MNLGPLNESRRHCVEDLIQRYMKRNRDKNFEDICVQVEKHPSCVTANIIADLIETIL